MTRTAIILSLAGLTCFGLAQELIRPQPAMATDKALSHDTPARDSTPPPMAVGHPSFLSPHARPIALHGNHVFVVNTPADTVDVIDTATRAIVHRIHVGIDPVAIAVRPDGREVWVANHISDSVSVIDTDPTRPTYLQVIATVQAFDPDTRATRFDEPVGIAFANNEKAYVALSSENEIAVINMASYSVQKRLSITAQDPRAIVVHGDRLYVLPFESNNQTQLSGGTGPIDGDLITFDAHEHAIANNNVLSLGAVLDIVKHPRVPDRDLYVFDTKTDRMVEVVDTLGTLLYGLTVDSTGRVFIAQTDARNEVNGRAGTQKHGLAEMENRAFLNQITRIDFQAKASESPTIIELEPLPPDHPAPGQALATPFAIQISDDDSTLVVSAAGSDKIFTVDVASGAILGRVGVGAVPRGIALASADDGRASQAWVLNAVANTVSLVDLSDSASPQLVDTIALADPTHPALKRGRIAFNKAAASTTETFSCASCHPDGHTDQLLWVLNTPIVTRGDQIMPRSTMPVRGLRDTEPYHWDGIPGDPYGGNNSANVYGHVAPNSRRDDPQTSTRHLVDAGLATTMSLVGHAGENDEGKAGALTAVERDDMAIFLLGVPYPPAQRRAYTNVLSSAAAKGFELFHINGDLQGKPRPNVCGDCHRMPFWVSTNTPGTGMDAPTWRGAYDRWLILPQGRLNIIDFDFYRRITERGTPERSMWQFSWAGRRRFDPVWDMVLEGSTGYSGSFARQVTLNRSSAQDDLRKDLLNALELSAREGGIVLQGEGIIIDKATATPVALQFDPTLKGGRYVKVAGTVPVPSATLANHADYSRNTLISLAKEGRFLGTLTARHGIKADIDAPQPALWTLGPIEAQRGHQNFPYLYKGKKAMTLSGRHLRKGANLIVDGRRVPGTLTSAGQKVAIKLATLPSVGTHFLQVQNPDGLFSNDFIFHVVKNKEAAQVARRRLRSERSPPGSALATAISKGNLKQVRNRVAKDAKINARNPESGSTPLSTAALHGHLDILRYLIEQGAKVTGTNRDGNTALHVAAFLADFDTIELLLENGASVSTENTRGETPIDVVSSPWNRGLAEFYRSIGDAVGLDLDLERIERDRPRVVELLRKKDSKTTTPH